MSALLIIGLKNAILVVPLALLAVAIGRWSRRPALSHLMWTLVLVKLLTPPLIHLPVGWQLDVESWLHANRQSVATNSVSTEQAPADRNSRAVTKRNSLRVHSGRSASQQAAIPPSSQRTPQSYYSTIREWLSWNRLWAIKAEILIGIWLSGSLYVLTKLAWRSFQFHRFLRLVERRHESLGPRAADLAARARITIAPRVIVVDSVVSPMLWGMGRRACLVFPSKLVARLSPQELDALLLHELAHFARGDHWVRVLELASSVLYWWHPVIWWARYELEIAEEQCCDAWVVEHQNGARISYAEALLATIDFLHEPATARPPVACGLGEVPFLRRRLTQIMRGQVAARLPSAVTTFILAGGILCSPLEPALWANGSGNPSMFERGWNNWVTARSARNGSRIGINDVQTQVSVVSRELQSSGLPSRTRAESGDPSFSAKKTVVRPSKNVGASSHVWATARAPNGKYRLEAKVLPSKTTLFWSSRGSQLDLTSYQITCLSFAADSSTFATGHDDGAVRRWDSDTGVVLQPYKGCDTAITSVHLCPDGRFLAAGTESGRVLVWDVVSGDEVARIDDQGLEISCLRWSRDGHRLAISLGAWNDRDESRLVIWAPVENRIVRNRSLDQPAGALEWTSKDDALVVAGWDGQSLILNLTTGEFVTEIQVDKDQVSAAAWSADCPLLSREIGTESAMRNE